MASNDNNEEIFTAADIGWGVAYESDESWDSYDSTPVETHTEKMLSDYLSSDNHVTLFVGPDRKQFVVHEELLCDRIQFFRAAFSGGFKETKEKMMEMPEDEPKAFAKLVDWLYEVPLKCATLSPHEEEWWGAEETYAAYEKHASQQPEHELLWCQLYALADKYNIMDLSHEANIMFQRCTYHNYCVAISDATIDYVYQNTAWNAVLRQDIGRHVAHRHFAGIGIPFELFDSVDEAQNEFLPYIHDHESELQCSSYLCCAFHELITTTHFEQFSLGFKLTYDVTDLWEANFPSIKQGQFCDCARRRLLPNEQKNV